ncbi:hypothetical protein ULMS_22780 [Patiriisocius marinistellae]|uniref:Uncharacterized protein n=1 Tax=Patiriisocius marinistellae TaxID=2494560 RepID=A0A5J4FX05_9FLAO|nr:hypothetical protein [Patiriisocius marinistellae]GEQ86770.1 hypothetical protein ULMS_22780 [Patiriisocius marinistellae]
MKLFRKVRRKLIESGKFKSYLLYALGEILLIVIGISIAWKINNLNDIRKNRIVEVKIYESLYDELRTNLNVLDSSIVRYNTNTLSLQNTLNYVGVKSNKLTQETKDIIVQMKFRYTNLRNDALNSINNTNKFEFLENESLKVLIAEYPNEIKIFESQEINIGNIVTNKLKPIIEKHISLSDMLSKVDENFNQIRTFGQQSNYETLLNSREYQNSIIDRLLQTEILLNYAKDLRKKTETLAVKLKQELSS